MMAHIQDHCPICLLCPGPEGAMTTSTPSETKSIEEAFAWSRGQGSNMLALSKKDPANQRSLEA